MCVTENSAVSVEANGDLELDKESGWGEESVPGVFFLTLRILDPESGLLFDRDAYSLRLEV